jgi:hypothetical protein
MSTINAGSTTPTALTLTGNTDGTLDLATGGTTRMLIDGSGNVGIGTASPDSKLSVYTATGTTQIRFGASSNYYWDISRDNDTTGDLWISNYNATGSRTTRMAVSASGNVGIGTANTPSNKDTVTPKFIVNGSGVAGSMQVVRNTTPGAGGGILELTATRGTDVNSYTVLQSGDGLGSVVFGGADGNEFVVAASVVAQVDGTPGDNDMPGRLIFNTTADGASSTTERMRITSTGNVGIGTASPTQKLTVNGGRSLLRANSETYSIQLEYASGKGQYYIGATDSVSTPALVFSNIGGVERMRVDHDGNVGIGTAGSSNVRLDIYAGTSAAGSYCVAFRNSSATNLFYIENHGTIFTGSAANSPYNLTTGSAANVFVDSGGALYRSTSSLRYKSDVTDATHGLADVLKLRSVTYKAKNSGGTVFGGLIAEEVHGAGLTEFVSYDKEGQPDAIHYGNMVALLTKAIQEQQAMIDELKAKVAALETK